MRAEADLNKSCYDDVSSTTELILIPLYLDDKLEGGSYGGKDVFRPTLVLAAI